MSEAISFVKNKEDLSSRMNMKRKLIFFDWFIRKMILIS